MLGRLEARGEALLPLSVLHQGEERQPRRAERSGPRHAAHRRGLRIQPEELAQVKVTELGHQRSWVHQDVTGFDVAVGDPVAMEILYRPGITLHDGQLLVQGRAASFHKVVEIRAAQLHHHPHRTRSQLHVQDLHQIRVVELQHALEVLLLHPGVALALYLLDGDRPTLRVPAPAHHSPEAAEPDIVPEGDGEVLHLERRLRGGGSVVSHSGPFLKLARLKRRKQHQVDDVVTAFVW